MVQSEIDQIFSQYQDVLDFICATLITLAAEDITQNQFIKLGNVPSVSFYVLHHAAPFHISLPHHAAPYHAAP